MLKVSGFFAVVAVLAYLAWSLKWRHSAWKIYCAALAFLVFLLYVLYFATHVYPRIPYGLGGGKPLTVVFVLKPEDHRAALVVADRDTNKSIPYKLLTTTDKTFVVLTTDERALSIEFNRDAVAGVVVLKDSGVEAASGARTVDRE